MRKLPIFPSGSAISTTTLRLLLSTGTRSAIGVSHQSTSPFCSAADAVAGSAMTTHSMRSTKICLPPESHELGSCRGTYSENFSKDRPRARDPFAAHELHRSAADVVADGLEWVGGGDARRHDEA